MKKGINKSILFYIPSVLFFIASAIGFTSGNESSMAIVWLCLGFSFLCFATGFAVVFFHLQIVNVEEDFLIEAFGNEYLQYKSKVCRYLGRKR